jgi:hypothetical protein
MVDGWRRFAPLPSATADDSSGGGGGGVIDGVKSSPFELVDLPGAPHLFPVADGFGAHKQAWLSAIVARLDAA